MDYSIIIAAFISFFTAIFASGIWALIAQRKVNKAKAENTEASTAEIIERVAGNQLLRYQKRIDELEMRIGKLENELNTTMDCLIDVVTGGHQLFGQVKQLGADPVYTPPPMSVITRPRSKVNT